MHSLLDGTGRWAPKYALKSKAKNAVPPTWGATQTTEAQIIA